MKQITYALFLLACTIVSAQQLNDSIQKWSGNRPDGHGPISVMGDHTHAKGDFMVSYRYMHMLMEDLKRGSNDENFNDVLLPNGGDYMVTPTKMPMQMHMLGFMYAPTQNLTLSLMGNITKNDMDHLTGMGGTFTTESFGFGDLKLNALYKIFNKNRQQLHGQIGFSFPTGSIDSEDVTPASNGNEIILPYPMQIGSGTFDPNLGLTFLTQSDVISFGSQLNMLFRIGENKNGYRLGNQYNLNNWLAFKTTDWLSFSARIQGKVIGEIEGMNEDLNPMMVITANTENSGGTYLNGGLGFNIYIPTGSLRNMRFGFEFSSPLYQDLNGVQLKEKETFMAGLQYAFN